MALRSKTIEYSLPTLYNESVGSFQPRTVAYFPAGVTSSMMIYIPETGSRTFLSCRYWAYLRDSNVDGGAGRSSIAGWNIGCGVGTSSLNNLLTMVTIADTTEQVGVVVSRDITSLFTSSFGNEASQSISCSFLHSSSIGANGTASINNFSQKLIITYQYDDASTDKRIKTVRIPLESFNGDLARPADLAASVIMPYQVPALDTFLPEASKIYRSMWFEMQGNESATSAGTGLSASFRLDGGTVKSETSPWTQGCNSSVLSYYNWPVDSMVTSTTHSFRAFISSTRVVFANICPTLYVTYEYDHAASTRVLNSVLIPFNMNQVSCYATSAADFSMNRVPIYIEEPDPIEIRQSAVRWMFMTGTALGLYTKIGNQSNYRAVNHNAGSTTCGGYCYQQRFDSGSVGTLDTGSIQGRGHRLDRGLNYVDVYSYCDTSVQYCGSGIVILNYTSSVSRWGDGVHNHSVFYSMKDKSDWVSELIPTPTAPTFIPETSYYLNGLGAHWYPAGTVFASSFRSSMQFMVEATGSSGSEYGVNTRTNVTAFSQAARTDAEHGDYEFFNDLTPFFNRYSGSREGKMDIKTPRRYMLPYTASESVLPSTFIMHTDWSLWGTYHSILFNITGSVSGSAVSGSQGDLSVNFHRASDDAYLFTAKTLAGGGFTGSWYDNTEQIYATAYESQSSHGRSKNMIAGGNP